jgi:hypothetical protein
MTKASTAQSSLKNLKEKNPIKKYPTVATPSKAKQTTPKISSNKVNLTANNTTTKKTCKTYINIVIKKTTLDTKSNTQSNFYKKKVGDFEEEYEDEEEYDEEDHDEPTLSDIITSSYNQISTPNNEKQSKLFSSFIEKEIRISKLELEDELISDIDINLQDLIIPQQNGLAKNISLCDNKKNLRLEVFNNFNFNILR